MLLVFVIFIRYFVFKKYSILSSCEWFMMRLCMKNCVGLDVMSISCNISISTIQSKDSWHILSQTLDCGTLLGARIFTGCFFQPSFLFLSESEISKYQRHSVGDLTKMLVLDINSMWRYFDYFTVSSQWKTFSEELCCSSLFRRSTSNLYRTLANYLLWVSTGSESAEKQEICWVLPSLGKILGKWGKVR